MKALPDNTKAFAHTQALWRFLKNDCVTPTELSAPLVALAHESVRDCCDDWALAVHDWSRINYNQHSGKKDRYQMTHATDVGYELQSSVLVSDCTGEPLAAPVQNLVTAEGVWQSRASRIQANDLSHLDELTERIAWLEAQKLEKPLVHIIDREADSVGHLRTWSARDWNWLVRVKEGNYVSFGGKTLKLSDVASTMTFIPVREVVNKGQTAEQWLAGTHVILSRKAKPKRKDASGNRSKPQAGKAISVRLVVSRIYDSNGTLLAQWYLLSNLSLNVPDAQLALWYYYRWQIESYFKLLKEAGHQLESWEQETGLAIFKRILIAGCASVLAWRLMRTTDEVGQKTRDFLVRLSGRQMKRSQPITAPALLDGMFKLFAMLETFQQYSMADLQQFADFAFPRLFSNSGG
jgi:hypothetical protein